MAADTVQVICPDQAGSVDVITVRTVLLLEIVLGKSIDRVTGNTGGWAQLDADPVTGRTDLVRGRFPGGVMVALHTGGIRVVQLMVK
jgi:hypothetical protein